MSKVRGLFLLSLLSLLSTSLLAWEMDVHYGLTKWLAFQAGFSLVDAEVIARGAEAPDEGKLFPAPSAVFKAACLGTGTGISRRWCRNITFLRMVRFRVHLVNGR
jgi:hypothetical protein